VVVVDDSNLGAPDGVFDFDDAFLALTASTPFCRSGFTYSISKQGTLDSCSVIDIRPPGQDHAHGDLADRPRHKARVPTRLIYVDRRTVSIRRPTSLEMQDNCKQHGIDPPAISTLRGQLATTENGSKDSPGPPSSLAP